MGVFGRDPYPTAARFALEIVGNFDVDLEGRHLVTALEPHDDLGRVQRDVPGHDGENFLTQHTEQIGLAAQSAFMGKQICSRSRATGAEALLPRRSRSRPMLMQPSVAADDP